MCLQKNNFKICRHYVATTCIIVVTNKKGATIIWLKIKL